MVSPGHPKPFGKPVIQIHDALSRMVSGVHKVGQCRKIGEPKRFQICHGLPGRKPDPEQFVSRWTSLRKFRPSPSKIKELIIEHKITTDLVYGRFDRMIPFENGVAFSRGLESYCRLTVLPTGHQLLSPRNLDAIISAFYS